MQVGTLLNLGRQTKDWRHVPSSALFNTLPPEIKEMNCSDADSKIQEFVNGRLAPASRLNYMSAFNSIRQQFLRTTDHFETSVREEFEVEFGKFMAKFGEHAVEVCTRFDDKTMLSYNKGKITYHHGKKEIPVETAMPKLKAGLVTKLIRHYHEVKKSVVVKENENIYREALQTLKEISEAI